MKTPATSIDDWAATDLSIIQLLLLLCRASAKELMLLVFFLVLGIIIFASLGNTANQTKKNITLSYILSLFFTKITNL